MEKIMKDIWVDEKDGTLEADLERRVRAMGVSTIAQLFEKAGMTVDAPLQHNFQVHFGMPLTMDVCYFFDLLCELGSLDRLHMTYGQKLILKRFLNSIYAAYLEEEIG
eukprot:gene19408-22063_t